MSCSENTLFLTKALTLFNVLSDIISFSLEKAKLNNLTNYFVGFFVNIND